MDEISIEKARPRLGDLVRDAQRDGVATRITLYGKPAAVLMPVTADADRGLAARARALRAAAADEATLRRHTGETDSVLLAYVRWSGQARELLAELADRLDPPSV